MTVCLVAAASRGSELCYLDEARSGRRARPIPGLFVQVRSAAITCGVPELCR